MTCVLLIDNGSKRPEATLQLRRLASALGEKAGKEIHPVSLQHADKINAAELNDVPAQTFTGLLSINLLKECVTLLSCLYFSVTAGHQLPISLNRFG